MPNARESNKPTHVTKGNVFEELGLTRSEALEAKIKADLWRDVVDYIATLQLTQKELARRLEVHQPEVSSLLSGKLSKFSTGTLISYAARLDFDVQVKLTLPKGKVGAARKTTGRKTRRGLAASVEA